MREFLVTGFDKRLDTRQASVFLTASGYTTAPATLNKLRCIGGGPPFEKFGRRPLYSEKSLLEWVHGRTTGPLRFTSDPENKASPLDAPIEARPIRPTQRPLGRPRRMAAAHRPQLDGGKS
jgi:hypothetical protein